MGNHLKFFLMLMIGMLLVSACVPQPTPAASQPAAPTLPASSTPTPERTPTVDPQAEAQIKAIQQLCGKTLPGQVCFGQGPVQAEIQPGRLQWKFREPGNVISLNDVQRLKVGQAGSTGGVALLRIQTENPGQAFTAVAFGDVEMVNAVAYGTREFNGMQSMKLAIAPNQAGQAPKNYLLVQAPGEGSLSTLVINGVEMAFGSTAFFTNTAGALTIQTLAGIVNVGAPDQQQVEVKQGTQAEVPLEPLTRDLPGEDLLEPLTRPAPPVVDYWTYFVLGEDLLPKKAASYDEYLLDEIEQLFIKRAEFLKKQRNWKGGWWRETYGPRTESGSCDMEAAGDGGDGSPGEPLGREIPICRGNHGNTILMYDSGTSYDRIGPNMYATNYVNEQNIFGTSGFTITSSLQTLRIVSPTRMILTYNSSSSAGCTTSHVIYLDFVRDDPNVRCGKIIDMTPYTTPRVSTPPPPPTRFEDPPVAGEYAVRMGIPTQACDAAAKALAPNFKAARVSFTPEKNLVLEAPSARYELTLTGLPIDYYSARTGEDGLKLGNYRLEQPLPGAFQLMMSLVEAPGKKLSGDWLVTNADGSQMCSGSIDLAFSK